MRMFVQALLVLVVCLGAAAAVTVWPYQNYVEATGQGFIQDGTIDVPALWKALEPPAEWTKDKARFEAWAFLAGGVLVGLCLAFTGLAWSFLKHWRPFATAFAGSLIFNAGLITLGQLDDPLLEWAPWLLILTVPLGLGWMAFAFFQGVTGSPIVRTLFRMIMAMVVTAVMTLAFPFIVLLGAIGLKLSRGVKITDTIKGAPNLFEFLIMNINPIFFVILPELLAVQGRARNEIKGWKGKVPKYQSYLDIGALKVGDVILTGVNQWGVAAPIQASNILSSSKKEADRYWCHTAIYKGNGEIIEAITEPHQPGGKVGVVVSTMEDLFRKGNRLRVLRHRYLDDATLQKVVDYCQAKASGECKYDYWGASFYALTALMPPMLSGWLDDEFAARLFNVSDAYFCSELIAEAFTEHGHDIFGRKAWRIKPLDFAYTPLFKEVPGTEFGYKHESVA